MSNVYIVNGLPASGKSTVATQLSHKLQLPLFTKDQFKECMGEVIAVTSVDESMQLGAISFRLLYVALRAELTAGKSCIVEANFNRKFDRDKFIAIFSGFSADSIEIYCHCDNDVRERRYLGRLQSGNRHSVHLDDRRKLPQITPDLEPLAINENVYMLDTANGYELGFAELLGWLEDQKLQP